MKMKPLHLLTALFFLVVSFTACKKETSPSNDNTEEASVQSDDQARVSSEIEAAANDADAAMETSASFSGRYNQAQTPIICDAVLAYDSVSNPRTISITYSGSNCWGTRTRTGTIILSMAQGVHWKDAGAAITITFQNFKITRVADNKSITINGSQTYTNVSGGLLINLPNL